MINKLLIRKFLCFMWDHMYHENYTYGDCGRKTWLCSCCTNKSYTKPVSGIVTYRVIERKEKDV